MQSSVWHALNTSLYLYETVSAKFMIRRCIGQEEISLNKSIYFLFVGTFILFRKILIDPIKCHIYDTGYILCLMESWRSNSTSKGLFFLHKAMESENLVRFCYLKDIEPILHDTHRLISSRVT